MNASDVRTIGIVLFDGFDELDAIGPYEVFQNARALGADLSTDLCTITPRETITASHGLEVVSQTTLADGQYDLVVVPGGGWNDRSDPGAWTEAQRGAVPDAVAEHHANGGLVASVCTGGMLLATAGLTDGRPAITHHSAIDDLRESGAEVVDARVVDDGDIVTAGGVTSGIDLALWIVERSSGADVAAQVAREMEYDRTDDVYEPSAE